MHKRAVPVGILYTTPYTPRKFSFRREATMKRFPAALLLAILISCCTAPIDAQASDLSARRSQFRAAIEAEWQWELRTHPEFATYVGDGRYNDRLDNRSPKAIAREAEENKRQLALFTAIDATGFSQEELLNKQWVIRRLEETLDHARSRDWEMPVNQMNG